MSIAFITGFLWVLVIVLHLITRLFFSSGLPALSPVASVPIPPVSKIERYCLYAIIIVACLLRISGMTRSLFYDEIITADFFVENNSIWETVSTQVQLNNHVAYSLMGRISEFIFGKSEWALRLPALLMGLAGIYAVWVFGRSLFTPAIGLAGAFILMLSPEHVMWSESARGYTGLMFFGLLANHFYFKLLEKPSSRTSAAFIFSGVMTLYVHLYGVFFLLAQVVHVAILVWKRKLGRFAFISVWDSLLKTAVIGYVLYSPLIPQMAETIGSHGKGNFLPMFPVDVFTMLCGYGEPLLQALIFLVCGYGLIHMKKDYLDKIIFFGLLLLLPLLLVWFGRPFAFFPRFFAYFLPYFALILGAGLVAIWNRISIDGSKKLFLRIVCGIFVLSMIFSWVTNEGKRLVWQGFREAVQFMEKDLGPDDIICFIGGGAELFSHYAKGMTFIPESQADFDWIKNNTRRVRCAYRQKSWEPRLHTDIAQYLAGHTQTEEFPGITVFYTKKDQ